jgi:hypothetical protein
MKIELSRAEIERIILTYVKNEVVPYVNEVKPSLDDWCLPMSLTLETKDESQ